MASSYEIELTTYTYSTEQMTLDGGLQLINNINTTSDLSQFVYSSVERILVTVIAPLIFAVGIIGNVAVVIVFHHVSDIRTTTNYFLISLAFADMVFLFGAVPAYWGQYLTSPIPLDFTYLGRTYCKIHVFLSDVGIIVSCLTIGLVTLERYLAICWPLLYRSISDKNRIVFSCGMVWIFSFVYKIPDIIFSDLYLQPVVLQWPDDPTYANYPTRFSTCDYCQPRDEKPCQSFRYSLAIDQIIILVEIPIISILYIFVVLELRRLSKSSETQSVSQRSIDDKITVIRMLIVTIIVYVICISPFRVINLLDIFGHHLPINAIVLVHVTRMMMYTNSAVNPILYNIISNSFSKAFRQTFCRSVKFHRKKRAFENVLLTDLHEHTTNNIHVDKSNIRYNLVPNSASDALKGEQNTRQY